MDVNDAASNGRVFAVRIEHRTTGERREITVVANTTRDAMATANADNAEFVAIGTRIVRW